MTSTFLSRAAITVAVTLLIVVSVLAGACSSDKKTPSDATDAEYQTYFAQLTPAVAVLVQQIPKLDTSGNVPAATLAQTLQSYDDSLIAFADALDKAKAPGLASSPHENFRRQSREIAKAFDALRQKLSSPSHTATSDELTLSLSLSGAVVQWVAACARLNDLARTKGMQMPDYHCATTLSIGSAGG